MRAFIVLLLAVAASARLAPLLTQRNRIPGRYIVKLKEGHSIDTSIASLGDAKILYKFKTVFPGFAAQLSDRLVERLRKSDAVEYIEEDGVVEASSVASWGLDRIDQLSLPLDDVYTPIGDGNGVDVYVIDTGININHVDYQGRSALSFDAFGGTGADCNGHGTHCAGTVAGTDYGVAKAANIFGVRVLNCMGSGSWSGVVAGCEWVAENANGPSVASMSLGGGASTTVDDAIQVMIDAGITVAVAAGNDDDNACNYSPARAVEAITVGATDSSDDRAYFSNYGTCVDIFAPGVSITSAWIGGSTASNTISGTSMACPHVAGAAAIVLGINGTITPAEVTYEILTKSISGVVSDPGFGSPNLLLYMGEGNGGGEVPDPEDPSDPTDPADPTCGGFFNATSGVFASPNYPASYDNNADCDFDFTAAEGEVISLTFNNFELESSSTCSYDSVSIYDGADSSAPLIGEYCGSNSPGTVTSSGSSLYMKFTSDSSVTYSGFSGAFTMREAPDIPTPVRCGDIVTRPSGIVKSPNFPDYYDNSDECTFTLQGKSNETVTLSFTDFDVEDHSSCNFDALEIYEGVDDTGPLRTKLCGSEIPRTMRSFTNAFHLKFTTDSSVTRTGFRALFTIQ
ncbi:extracellular serine proteinase-like [Lytechinus variegatus]|uniref:extracellular serine proteinase-like n=1 Tax=Lytechinus variegatus TaxID=7654 RepID=UPI001BB1B806|nr:extracellular serine proteinase-like [Lytechinus variegatus]